MGSCCTKRDENLKTENGQKQLPAGGITSNEIPKLREFATRYFMKYPKNTIITLNFQKDQLKNFITQLEKLMTTIKEKSGKVMIPVAIQQSPLNPDAEMVVIMKPIEEFYEFQGLIYTPQVDIQALSKRFVIKAYQFISKDNRAAQLQKEILQFYATENLLFLGGVQERAKANSIQLLFYKIDKLQQRTTTGDHDQKIEILPQEERLTKQEFSSILSNKQMAENKVFRGVVTYQDVKRTDFIILQECDVDQMHMVDDFNDLFDNERYTKIKEMKNKTPGFDEMALKEEIMEKISESFQLSQSSNFGYQVQNIIVYNDLQNVFSIQTMPGK